MTKNRYSIILPVRNGGEHVKECISSILLQSYPHFDLHVLDNSSTDGTLEWINSLKDERIVVYPSDVPLTIEQNWGRVTGIPKNEFMTITGHDDVFLPAYLEEMNALIEKHPEASLYQTQFNFIDAKGAFIRACKPVDEIQPAAAFLEKMLTMNIDITGTGFMTRSKDYDAMGGIPSWPNLLFADFNLWMQLTRISFKATSSRNCFSYRLHQSMTAVSPVEKFQAAFDCFIKYLYQLKQEDAVLAAVIHKNVRDIISFYCRSFSHRLLRIPKVKRKDHTVAGWIDDCRGYADLLIGEKSFDPLSVASIRLARWIDSNAAGRNLFLAFKKIYSKPVF